jgi:hypothetical protein
MSTDRTFVIVDAGLAGAKAAETLRAEGFEGRLLLMAAEVIRSGLAGLAIWWTDHPDVPREQVVATAVDVLWTGLERGLAGEAGRA